MSVRWPSTADGNHALNTACSTKFAFSSAGKYSPSTASWSSNTRGQLPRGTLAANLTVANNTHHIPLRRTTGSSATSAGNRNISAITQPGPTMPVSQVFLPFPDTPIYHRPLPFVAFDESKTSLPAEICLSNSSSASHTLMHPLRGSIPTTGMVQSLEPGATAAWHSPRSSTDSSIPSLVSPGEVQDNDRASLLGPFSNDQGGFGGGLIQRTDPSRATTDILEQRGETARCNPMTVSEMAQSTRINNLGPRAAESCVTFIRPPSVVTYHAVSQPSLVGQPVYPALIVDRCLLAPAQAQRPAATAVSMSSYPTLQAVQQVPTPLPSYTLVSTTSVRVSDQYREEDDVMHVHITPSSEYCEVRKVSEIMTSAGESHTDDLVSTGTGSEVEEDSSDYASGDNGSHQGNRSLFHCQWRLPDESTSCNMPFRDMADLVDHITHHVNAITDRVFVCSWKNCERRGVAFKAKYKLVNHVRVHTNEKPFVCKAERCGRLFARSENLRIHMRVHSGEKPFKCPHPSCGKSFANSSDRKKHTFVHSQERPYVCKEPGCSKRYTHPSSLRKHALLHKGHGMRLSY